MSLFENSSYEYCDTFFVFLDQANTPTVDAIEIALAELGPRYVVENMKERDGKFLSATVKSRADFSGMDLTLVTGEEVDEQIKTLDQELRHITLHGGARDSLKKLLSANARYDVFHFEEQNANNEDEFLDPGGLLLVLQKIASTCDGVGYDPQSQDII
jgi:hypothetical protein